MSLEPSAKVNGLKVQRFDADEVYFLLSDPVRRQFIRALADGELRTGVEMNAASGKKRHAYTKDLAMMLKAGILVQKGNPHDRRSVLYGFAPGVGLCRKDDYLIVDLGSAVFRLPICPTTNAQR